MAVDAHAGRFAEISSNPDYKILVLEDTETGKVVGTASLIMERKFLRGLGKVSHNDNSQLLQPRHRNHHTVKLTVLVFCLQCGHIEDVVIDSSKRGQKLGARCACPPCCHCHQTAGLQAGYCQKTCVCSLVLFV